MEEARKEQEMVTQDPKVTCSALSGTVDRDEVSMAVSAKLILKLERSLYFPVPNPLFPYLSFLTALYLPDFHLEPGPSHKWATHCSEGFLPSGSPLV